MKSSTTHSGFVAGGSYQSKDASVTLKITLFLLMFFFSAGPVLNSIHPIFDFMFLSGLSLVLIQILYLRRRPPPYYKVFLILVPVFIYAGISLLFYEDVSVNDYVRIILKPVRVFIAVLAGATLVTLFRRANLGANSVYLYLYYSISLSALVMIVQFLYPEFKDFVYSFTRADDMRELYSYDYNFRMGGLAGGYGSSTLSVAQAFGVLLLPFVCKGRGNLAKFGLRFLAVLIVLSVLLSGRSGVFVLLLFYPWCVLRSNNSKSVSKSIWFIFAMAGMIGGIAGLVMLTSILDQQSDIFYAVRRSLETFINIAESGTFNDDTVNTLFGHLLIPPTADAFLLGSAEHMVNTHFDRSLGSDIGFIRNIWTFGAVMVIGYWLPYILFFLRSVKTSLKDDSVTLLKVIIIMSILLHLKEDVLYSRILLSYLSIILAVFHFERRPIGL